MRQHSLSIMSCDWISWILYVLLLCSCRLIKCNYESPLRQYKGTETKFYKEYNVLQKIIIIKLYDDNLYKICVYTDKNIVKNWIATGNYKLQYNY